MEAGDVHTQADKEISEEELWAIQRRLNATNAMFIKIFKVGEGQDQIERHRSNSIGYSANPSSMKIFHKDHKEGKEIKTRRINGPGMNTGQSNFIAEILEHVADEMPRNKKMECGSTESALNLVDSYN